MTKTFKLRNLVHHRCHRVDGRWESRNIRSRQWNVRIGVRCVRGTGRGKICSNPSFACRNIPVVQSAIEILQCGDGCFYVVSTRRFVSQSLHSLNALYRGYRSRLTLVVGDLMTGLIHTRKAEIAVLANLAILSVVNDHSIVPCAFKLLTIFVFDGKADGFAAKPIT
jgi:hypothetical protein